MKCSPEFALNQILFSQLLTTNKSFTPVTNSTPSSKFSQLTPPPPPQFSNDNTLELHLHLLNSSNESTIRDIWFSLLRKIMVDVDKLGWMSG